MIAPIKGMAAALPPLVCSMVVAESEGAVATGAREEPVDWAEPPVATTEVEIPAEEAWEWERGAEGAAEEAAAEDSAAEEAAAEDSASEEAAAEEAAAEEAAAAEDLAAEDSASEEAAAEDLAAEDSASEEAAAEEALVVEAAAEEEAAAVEVEVLAEEVLVEEAALMLWPCSPHWALKADTAVSASPLGQIEFKVEITVEPLDSQIQEKSWRPLLHSASLETWATAARRQA